jgi:sulfate permease, SulP family
MRTIIAKIRNRSKEFVPKSFICFREGYTPKLFYSDLFSGICVGIIAIPLALAFAIASGVTPEKGLFTAIVAGFLISALGGSRVQIGGPTGAYVVLLYSIISKFGYSGLALATLIAGIMLILFGLARFGILLKFISFPVTVGFTTGIALVIFSSQIKDFFGLDIGPLPPEFIEKCKVYFHNFHTANLWAFSVALATLVLIFLFRRLAPRLPGAMIAIGLATLVVSVFHLPIETIGSKFGEIPRSLPKPSLPFFSWDLLIAVFPSAITVALLGAIESLLCASIADGMIGAKHRSNCELVAQGLANIGSVIFGGIPATGAIARTTANVKLGGKTPVAGMVHAITILTLMLFFAPYVAKIPLAALSGVLVFVAWNMSELPHFIEILRGQKGDAFALAITFVLTVLMDLTVAVQAGVLLSAIVFLKRMTDRTTLKACQILAEENNDETPKAQDELEEIQETLPKEIAIFEVNGPFFYSVSHLLEEALIQLTPPPQIFILNLHKTPLIDSTGQKALKQFHYKCQQKNIIFLIVGAKPDLFRKSKLESLIGKNHLFPSTQSALAYAKKSLPKELTASSIPTVI